MSQNEMFQARLDEALTKRAMVMARQDIPQLKDACRTYQAAFDGIFKVLLEKGILQEDQYNYEQKISDLTPPPSDSFSESDMFNQMNSRLSAYLAQLDFLNNFFFMSPDTLDLRAIKNVLGLIDYIHWADLSVTAGHLMTRSTALYLEKLKKSADSMAMNIMMNSVKVLQEQNKAIKKILKGISTYAKENYKLTVRVNILSHMTLDPKRIHTDRSGTLQAIKFEFPVRWEGSPFFKQLIDEILEEDYSSQGENLQAQILKNLEVSEKIVKKKKKNLMEDLKKDLMEVIQEMAKAYMPLETIITRMDANSRLLDENPSSFSEKFSRWFKRVMLRKLEVYYDIKDSKAEKGNKKEHLNFTSYINWLRMKASFYKSLNNPKSQSYTRAKESSCDDLEEFLAKNQQELKRIHSKLTVLEMYFKESAEGPVKNQIKGFKAELTQLKGIVGKVITGLKEYQARKEEMDQLRNLGIDPDSN